MYLSHLLIDVGSNPDRPRPGRRWLNNIYHVHQRLSMAFPTPVQCAADPQFVASFDPAGFSDSRFLFRIDNSIEENCPRAIILVQSAAEPDWGYAFQNARMFLAAEPETRAYLPELIEETRFHFRIRVNLTQKSKQSQDGDDLRKISDRRDVTGRAKDQSKRVSLTWKSENGEKAEDVIVPWFANKGWVNLDGKRIQAFVLNSCCVLHLGWVSGSKQIANSIETNDPSQNGKGRRPLKFRSALLEGTLTVTHAAAFEKILVSGIGSAKAFGFGLLSLAPATIR